MLMKLILDCGVLCIVMQMLQGENADDWAHLFFVALGMAVANFVLALPLAFLGIFLLVPIAIVDGLILMFYCSLTLRQTAIALAILFAYNTAFYVALAAIF